MRSSEKKRSSTPSTESNSSQTQNQELYLLELLNLVYLKDYTYKELEIFFDAYFQHFDEIEYYQQQIIKTTQIYMHQILQNVKEQIEQSQVKNIEILNFLYQCHKKHIEVQQILENYASFVACNQCIINFEEVFQELFINIIIKDEAIQDFFEELNTYYLIQGNKIGNIREYQLLQFFNKLNQQKLIINKQITNKKIQNKQKQQRQSEKQQKLDEYKLFEKKLENIFSENNKQELLEAKLSEQWQNIIKSKLKKR